MRVAIDSNVILYAEGLGEPAKGQTARDILRRVPLNLGAVPAQALGEVAYNLVRKARWSRAKASAAVASWQEALVALPTSVEAFEAALPLSVKHDLQIWDAIIISVSAEAGCEILLSEDMQPGFAWGGLQIVNPFVIPTNPRLAGLLSSS